MASVRKRTWSYKGEKKTAWVVEYADGGGERRSKQFRLKKEADTYRDQVSIELRHGAHIPAAEAQTVRQIMEKFIRHGELRMRSGEIGRGRHETVISLIDHHIVPKLGARKWKDLTVLDVENWISDLRLHGRRDGGPLSAYVVRSLISILKMAEDYAIKHGYGVRPVVTEGRKGAGKLRTEPIRTFKLDEVRNLFDAIEQSRRGCGERDRCLLRCYVGLAAFCGLRLGEINALQPGNIDLVKMKINVRHNLTAYGTIKGPKTRAGVRDVPLPQSLAVALTEWLTVWYIKNPLGVAFTTRPGEPMYRIDFNRRWQRLLETAGLKDGRSLHFHALRHFAASFMIENGVPLADVARVLGHESFDMTLQVYAHPVHEVEHHQPAFERMVARVRETEARAEHEPGVLDTTMEDGSSLRERARRWLSENRLSQSALGRRVGMSPTQVSRWLSGLARVDTHTEAKIRAQIGSESPSPILAIPALAAATKSAGIQQGAGMTA